MLFRCFVFQANTEKTHKNLLNVILLSSLRSVYKGNLVNFGAGGGVGVGGDPILVAISVQRACFWPVSGLFLTVPLPPVSKPFASSC